MLKHHYESVKGTDFGINGIWVVSFTLRPFYDRSPLYRRLSRPYRNSECNVEDVSFPCRESKALHPVQSQLIYLRSYISSYEYSSENSLQIKTLTERQWNLSYNKASSNGKNEKTCNANFNSAYPPLEIVLLAFGLQLWMFSLSNAEFSARLLPFTVQFTIRRYHTRTNFFIPRKSHVSMSDGLHILCAPVLFSLTAYT